MPKVPHSLSMHGHTLALGISWLVIMCPCTFVLYHLTFTMLPLLQLTTGARCCNGVQAIYNYIVALATDHCSVFAASAGDS